MNGIFIYIHRMELAYCLLGRLRMNRDENILHPVTVVKYVMLIEQSVTEICFLDGIMREHSFFFEGELDMRISD